MNVRKIPVLTVPMIIGFLLIAAGGTLDAFWFYNHTHLRFLSHLSEGTIVIGITVLWFATPLPKMIGKNKTAMICILSYVIPLGVALGILLLP